MGGLPESFSNSHWTDISDYFSTAQLRSGYISDLTEKLQAIEDGVRPPTMMDKALDLARGGTPVFPCKASGEGAKKPLNDGGFKNATTDEKTIRDWWGKWGKAAIGMPTGHTTGVFIVDVDDKDGRDGRGSLRVLENEHGPLTCPTSRYQDLS